MGHTSVPEPATGWAGAVRNSPLAAPGAAADLTAGLIAALFRDHHGELVRLALLMVGDMPTAEDVVQDVYASLHARGSRLAECEALLPYVRAAVLNGCRSVLRRRGIARRVGVVHQASLRDEALASAESEAIGSADPCSGWIITVRSPAVSGRAPGRVASIWVTSGWARIPAVGTCSSATATATAAGPSSGGSVTERFTGCCTRTTKGGPIAW